MAIALCAVGQSGVASLPRATTLIPDDVVACGGAHELFQHSHPFRGLPAMALPLPSQFPNASGSGVGKQPASPGLVHNPEMPIGKRGATTETFNALVIFAKFRGEAEGDDTKPSWADDLFDPGLPGSFTHFYDEMSRGQLRVQGEVLPNRYSSLETAATYLAEKVGVQGDFARFNLEILQQADVDVDMGRFDNDGPDGVPNSGDDDGYVDVVFINLLTVPANFLIGTATGFASLGLTTDFISDDAAASGGKVRVRSRFSGFGGTTQRGHVFKVTAATMCHEFGHVLGLPDLFDQSSVFRGNELDFSLDSAGIGKWGLMGLGTLGWGIEDGPNAFSAWSLTKLGWLGENNNLLIDVEESMLGVEVDQVDNGGAVYRIPVSEDEYFLVENRQNSGSYYNRNIPQGGLLVWHVDERADNDEERHKQVDLICADGLFADRGFPGVEPDPIAGGDNLDFWARDAEYADVHNGNQGDATDPFDGDRFHRLDLDTNPGLRAYARFERGVPLGMALENIRPLENGRMSVDILIHQPVAGNISADTTWSGEIVVDGDVIVEPGVRLTLQSGTVVHFSQGDRRAMGFDRNRSELIVYGDLTVDGDPDEPVRLQSREERGRLSNWLGLFLMSGQSMQVEEAVDTGSLVVDRALYGIVRQRLPAGLTTWSQDRTLPWDLVVPIGAELRIEDGATLRFTATDLSGRGTSATLSELVVEGKLTVTGTLADNIEFTVASVASDSIWYGVVLQPDAIVAGEYLTVRQSGFAFIGEVSQNGLFHLVNSTIMRSINGINLRVFGDLTVDGTTITGVSGNAIRVTGSGHARLRSCTINDNGREGIYVANTNLHATDTHLESSGLLDLSDPRSGMLAEGGRGQRLELWNCTVTRNPLHGIQVDRWEGDVEIHSSEISANQRNGLNGRNVSKVVFENSVVARNIGHGAVFADSRMEVWTTLFEDNIGTGLVFSGSSSGVVELSRFTGSPGITIEDVFDVTVRNSVFQNGTFGIKTVDSSAKVIGNRFENNLTGLTISGLRIPSSIVDNSFLNNRTAIVNLTNLEVSAQGNYWGTTDTTLIASLFEGAVHWRPFLTTPTQTTPVEAQDGGISAQFGLLLGMPNPFQSNTHSNTQLRFNLPLSGRGELRVFDMRGTLVRVLVDQHLAAGSYRFAWNGRDDRGLAVASGVYLVELRVGRFRDVAKVTLLR